MNRTEYKNNFGREHYERINLAVPKGMKDIIKALASDKGMSVNAYIQDLVRNCLLYTSMRSHRHISHSGDLSFSSDS